jgi:hypothetical protein
MIDTAMGRPVVYLINTETDALITVDLPRMPGFPGTSLSRRVRGTCIRAF